MNKSDLLPIEKGVQESLNRYFSDHSTPFFVIGVSGGVDSMCLLYTFYKLQIPALVSHINYKKRGKESDKDAELVEQMAFQWNFKCHTTAIDYAEAEGNFQQWARDLRYEVFRNLAAENNAAGIAIAHNADDQIETILQKLFRGAGMESWGGMEVWNGELFRPFLTVPRSRLEKFAQNESIPFRVDRSNLESAFARNFLRNEWLPQLTDFFPGWRKNIRRIAGQASNYEQALEWIKQRMCDGLRIDRNEFHSLQANLQKALILHLVKQKASRHSVSRSSLAQIEKLGELQTGKSIQLTDTLTIIRDRAHYVLKIPSIEKATVAMLNLQELKKSPLKHQQIACRVEVYKSPDFKKALYLDADKLKWPLRVRRWQEGDHFQPLGMDGHQRISDHLTNRKISSAYKKQALVIESFEETICAVIFPPIKNGIQPGTISDKFKCHPGTRYCLKITYDE